MLVLRITAFVVCFHSYVVLCQYYPERRPTYRPPTYTPPTYRPPTYPPLGGCDPPTKNGYTSYAPERSSYAIGSRIIYSCTNGYVTGRTTRTCAGNLRWTGSAVRICGCFRPKNPEYGSVFSFPYNQQRFTPGEYVTFRCNPPYKLSGSSRVQCQQNGQWNNLPKCELAQTNCKKQQPPANGYYVQHDAKSDWRPGDTATYACDDNYCMTGQASLTCQQNSNWDYPMPTCRACCSRPEAPEYGSVVSTPRQKQYFDLGDFVIFRCRPGYTLSSQGLVGCQETGWANKPTCIKDVTCPQREDPVNGYRVKNEDASWVSGSKTTYGCGEHYCLYGHEVTTCQDDGSWDHSVPTCRVCCHRPNPPSHGSIHSVPIDRETFYLDDWIIYRCDEGYWLDGESKVGCLEGGWTPHPTCRRITCPHRDQPEYGYYVNHEDGKGWYPGDTAQYGCSNGYCMHGQADSNCLDDGTWQHDPPQCQACCARPNPPDYGSLNSKPEDKQTFYGGDWIIYRCDHGYRLVGESRVECGHGGWGVAPWCQRIKCPHRNPPEYGYYNEQKQHDSWYPDDVASYGCDNHYCMSGDHQSKCQYDGTWNGGVPSCRVCCQRPADPPEYGSFASDPENKQVFYKDEYITYSCDHGYRLVGYSRRTCTKTGWTPAPTCRRIKCPHRDAPEYGYYSNNEDKKDWYPEDSASYKCNNHYCMYGDNDSKCQYDGTWNQDVPSCRVCCKRPNPPPYSSIESDPEDKQTFYRNEYITYSCEYGYEMVGSSRRRCLKGGWTTEPTCRRISCPHRSAPEYGYYSDNSDKKDWYPEDSASYGCEQHYCMSGQASSSCQYDGSWQYPIPICHACCKRPQAPQYGSVHSTPTNKQTFYVGEWVSYSCDHGYKIVGNPRAQCEKGGWNSSPTCARVTCPHRNPPEYGNYANGNDDEKDWYPEDTAEYTCQNFYCLQGHAGSKCQYDGTWDYGKPECHSCCPRPTNPNKGFVVSIPFNKQTFYLHDAVIYRCDAGYRLVGNPRVVCRKGGWSHEPTCARVFCPHRDAPEYGHYTDDKKEWYPGDRASYSCQDGYCMDGYADSSCQNDGSWQYGVPSCRPCCKRPENPECGSVTSIPWRKATFYVDDTINYSCNDGCYLKGKGSVTCTKNGWSHKPTCQRGCAHRSPPGYGSYVENGDKSYWHPDEVARFGCNPRYFMYGSPTSTCLSDSSWDSPVPQCRPGCYRPSDIPYGSVVSKPPGKQNFAINDWVTYKCDHGYVLQGYDRSYCRIRGWDNTPTCKRTCPHRHPPSDVSYSPSAKSHWFVSDYIEYSCPGDYKMDGYSKSTCQSDGTWDNDMPKCRRPCKHRYPPRDGRYRPGTPHDFWAGETAHFECVDGYSMSGTASSYCQDDGKWRTPVPACEVRATCQGNCGSPNVGGCACDSSCRRNYDCCSDYTQYCETSNSGGSSTHNNVDLYGR